MQYLFFIAVTIFCATSAAEDCGCDYDAATRCSKGPTDGAKRLAAHFKELYDGAKTEIFNCRNISGSNKYSLHAEGRAVDLYLTGTKGREAFDYAVEMACSNGIQEVIFNRRIWTSDRGERDYRGLNPHIDHVHIGLNKCGAENFSAPVRVRS